MPASRLTPAPVSSAAAAAPPATHLAAMRAALDDNQPGERPAVDEIVARIGPLRNKQAFQSGGDGTRETRRSRRAR